MTRPKAVEDAEHELEVAASKLELIIEKNKKHEEALRHRHRAELAAEDGSHAAAPQASGLKPVTA